MNRRGFFKSFVGDLLAAACGTLIFLIILHLTGYEISKPERPEPPAIGACEVG